MFAGTFIRSFLNQLLKTKSYYTYQLTDQHIINYFSWYTPKTGWL